LLFNFFFVFFVVVAACLGFGNLSLLKKKVNTRAPHNHLHTFLLKFISHFYKF
jgi:hypothetical protein